MSSFSTYLVGFLILILGLGLGAWLLGVPPMWIAVGVIVLIGIGVLSATSRTKPRDPPSTTGTTGTTRPTGSGPTNRTY
ncbi:MAG TPA: hypothetical protein VFZ11_04635 [Gemmatimonadaceae bacterium]